MENTLILGNSAVSPIQNMTQKNNNDIIKEAFGPRSFALLPVD